MARRLSCGCEVWRLATLAAGCACLGMCVCVAMPTGAQAGELGEIASDVQSGFDSSGGGGGGGGGGNYDYDSYHEYEHESWGDFWTTAGTAAVAVVSSKNSGLEYAAYPYENDHEGYLADTANPDAETHPLSSRSWAEYGSDFDDVDLVSGGLLVEGDNRLGFDLTWRTYFEELASDGHDDLSTGDANFLFRLWQSDATSMRLGAGASWLEFDGEVDAGFNVTASGELYPVRPIILAWEWDAGKIGNASLLHGRATIGANLRHFEVYTGIDYLEIDDTDLTCLVTGLRTWW